MKKESWPIFYVIVSIGAFLLFLLEGSIIFLALSLIILPAAFIEMYMNKNLSFKLLLSSLLGVLIIQSIGVLFVYFGSVEKHLNIKPKNNLTYL